MLPAGGSRSAARQAAGGRKDGSGRVGRLYAAQYAVSKVFRSIDRLLEEQSLFEYDVIMMYSPPLPGTDAAQSHGWKEGLRCSMGR